MLCYFNFKSYIFHAVLSVLVEFGCFFLTLKTLLSCLLLQFADTSKYLSVDADAICSDSTIYPHVTELWSGSHWMQVDGGLECLCKSPSLGKNLCPKPHLRADGPINCISMCFSPDHIGKWSPSSASSEVVKGCHFPAARRASEKAAWHVCHYMWFFCIAKGDKRRMQSLTFLPITTGNCSECVWQWKVSPPGCFSPSQTHNSSPCC